MEPIKKGSELFMVIAGGKTYTYEDILALPEGERAELIDGEMFMMASPGCRHEDAVIWLSSTIFNYTFSVKKESAGYMYQTSPYFPKRITETMWNRM